MAKIAFLHHTFIAGSGIDGVLFELGKRLMTRGHDIQVMTLYSDNSYTGLPVTIFGSSGNRKIDAVFSPLYSQLVRRELRKFDVVHTQLYPASVVPLLLTKLPIKHIATEWGVQDVGDRLVEKLYTALLRKAENYVIENADVVLAGCEYTGRELRKIRPDVKTLYQYGIDFNFLCEKNVEPGRLEMKYPMVKKSDKVLLFIGRNSPHKRIDILVMMLKLIPDKNVKLVVVGRQDFGENQVYLESLVDKMDLTDRVLFTGVVPRSEIPCWYARCEMFVNASEWEGFLIPEAFAFHKPIIAYGAVAHKEVVGDDRGVLVSDLTPEGFNSAVRGLLDSPLVASRMGENGYRWAKEYLDYDIIAENWEKAVLE